LEASVSIDRVAKSTSGGADVALAGVVLLAALAMFVVRTWMQPQYRPGDFALYYTASQAWLAGENPYDTEAARARWLSAGGRADIMPEIDGQRLPWQPVIILPQTLPLLVPLAALPAKVAVVAWYALAALLLLAQTAALAELIGSRLWQPLGMLLLAITLVLAPVHETFGYAQPSGPAISLAILGAWAATRRRDLLAGVLLALAAALKPQVGGVFVLYYLLRGRWRLVGVTAALGAMLLILAVSTMAARDIPWLSGWRGHMAEVDRVGGYNSPLPENPMRRHMLNLQMIFGGALASFTLVNVAALALTAALASALALAVRRARRRDTAPEGRAAPLDELLVLSAVCVLGLLPVYHRFYDGALMVVPAAWALGTVKRRPIEASLVLTLVLSFVLPVPVTARAMQLIGIDPDAAHGLWWDFLLEPWRVWLLLGGVLLLTWWIARTRRPRAVESPQPDAAPPRYHTPADADLATT
jgi:hypothetical protein